MFKFKFLAVAAALFMTPSIASATTSVGCAGLGLSGKSTVVSCISGSGDLLSGKTSTINYALDKIGYTGADIVAGGGKVLDVASGLFGSSIDLGKSVTGNLFIGVHDAFGFSDHTSFYQIKAVDLSSISLGANFLHDLDVKLYANVGAGTTVPPVTAAVPEPATWAMLMVGMFAIGATLRSRSTKRMALAA